MQAVRAGLHLHFCWEHTDLQIIAAAGYMHIISHLVGLDEHARVVTHHLADGAGVLWPDPCPQASHLALPAPEVTEPVS